MLKVFDKRYNPDGHEESYQLSILAMIVLVLLMVVSVVYALYLFIHAMGISDAAGVHISKNLMLAVEKMQGKLYTNEEKGIINWEIYKNDQLGFSIKYPNDLLVTRTTKNELEFKKSGPSIGSKNQSLLYALVIGENDSVENAFVQDFIKNKYPEWEGEVENCNYGGKECARTGVFKSASGIYKDIVFWRMGSKTIYVESRYYSENNSEYKHVFNNVISEITFL